MEHKIMYKLLLILLSGQCFGLYLLYVQGRACSGNNPEIANLEFESHSFHFSDRQKMSVFGEIYTTGKKIYTAGGSDGSDKSHLWLKNMEGQNLIWDSLGSWLHSSQTQNSLTNTQ